MRPTAQTGPPIDRGRAPAAIGRPRRRTGPWSPRSPSSEAPRAWCPSAFGLGSGPPDGCVGGSPGGGRCCRTGFRGAFGVAFGSGPCQEFIRAGPRTVAHSGSRSVGCIERQGQLGPVGLEIEQRSGNDPGRLRDRREPRARAGGAPAGGELSASRGVSRAGADQGLVCPRGSPARSGGLLEQAGRRAPGLVREAPADLERVRGSVLQVVRGREAERLVQLPGSPRGSRQGRQGGVPLAR